MEIIADMHCHTIASTHAYSTIEEMIKRASEKGLYAIGITDHARAMPGAPGKWYFENMGNVIPEVLDGVRVIKGIETNVIDYEGNLDTDEITLNRLEWVIASMHEITLKPNYDKDRCTNAWLNVAKNPYVNVIGHSGAVEFEFNYEKVIPEFGRNGKLVEINNKSFQARSEGVKNCKKIAELCKKYSVNVILDSDSHFSLQVGVVNDAIRLLEEINFPEELIINSSKTRFNKYLCENGIKIYNN